MSDSGRIDTLDNEIQHKQSNTDRPKSSQTACMTVNEVPFDIGDLSGNYENVCKTISSIDESHGNRLPSLNHTE